MLASVLFGETAHFGKDVLTMACLCQITLVAVNSQGICTLAACLRKQRRVWAEAEHRVVVAQKIRVRALKVIYMLRKSFADMLEAVVFHVSNSFCQTSGKDISRPLRQGAPTARCTKNAQLSGMHAATQQHLPNFFLALAPLG